MIKRQAAGRAATLRAPARRKTTVTTRKTATTA